MKKFDYNTLKNAAAHSLTGNDWDPKRLVLIYTGASLALSLIIAVVDYLLEMQIDSAGGLSGLDKRTLLTTIQTVLRLVQTVALPFWSMGYVYTTLQWARREEATPGTLLQGFRKWGPVLRLNLLTAILFGGILFFSMYVGTFLFCLTPWAEPLIQIMLENLDAATAAELAAFEEALYAAAEQVELPLMCVAGLVFLVAAAPFFYRFRLAKLCLMDNPGAGAMKALGTSGRLMRGNYGAMIRLDLHFWWFHGLNLLVGLLCYGGTIASYAGIALPVSREAAYFICVGLYTVCQLGLDWWRRNEVSVTYVHVYETLKQRR